MKVTRLVSAVLLTRELRKKMNWINEVTILKNRKDSEKQIPSWLWIYLVVPKVMLMAGDHLFFLWRFMSTPHHENRNIGIYCKNVIELRRHWQHLKKIFKYSGNHHDFLFLFSYVKKREHWKETNLLMYIPPVSPIVAHKLPKNNHGCVAL